MSRLRTPIISTVIGEGGSGGALAIGVCDHLAMLQYSTYAVISPEGCASILWKTAAKAPDAAEAMGVTAARLYELGLIDQVIQEPLGGAHRDRQMMSRRLKENLMETIEWMRRIDIPTLIDNRYNRLMRYSQVHG
jgi:acetyl-CoA carboxylase carboxyl transferase subunit alpha